MSALARQASRLARSGLRSPSASSASALLERRVALGGPAEVPLGARHALEQRRGAVRLGLGVDARASAAAQQVRARARVALHVAGVRRRA